MRRVLPLLILSLILVALVLARPVVSDWHYIVSGQPGDLLYVAAFDGFLEDWERYEGRLSAQTADGVLRISADDNRKPYSTAKQRFADFDLQVTTQAIEGPLNNAYGVVFRLVDGSNYYVFLISSDGYYRVNRAVNGDEKTLSTWIPSPVIHQGLGEENQIRIAATGSQFQFFVNDTLMLLCIPDDPNAISTYVEFSGECLEGQMLDTLNDASIPAGRVGMTVDVTEDRQPGVVVEFDNVIVYEPQRVGG